MKTFDNLKSTWNLFPFLFLQLFIHFVYHEIKKSMVYTTSSHTQCASCGSFGGNFLWCGYQKTVIGSLVTVFRCIGSLWPIQLQTSIGHRYSSSDTGYRVTDDQYLMLIKIEHTTLPGCKGSFFWKLNGAYDVKQPNKSSSRWFVYKKAIVVY